MGCILRVSPSCGKSWKFMEFSGLSKTIVQAWKVMDNNVDHGQSLKMIVKSWNFYNYLHKFLTNVKQMIRYALNC